MAREEVAVVVEREVGVEAAVEAGEIAAEGEQFVELGEDLLVREDVAALLAGEFVEGAVVALGDADVGVVDDAHEHVGAGVRASGSGRGPGRRASRRSASEASRQRQRASSRGDALAGVDLAADVGERGGGGGHGLLSRRSSS